jgi:hypothetical protein
MEIEDLRRLRDNRAGLAPHIVWRKKVVAVNGDLLLGY